jgi:hypothetical protein
VRPINRAEKLRKDNLLLLPNTEWYPAYFNHSTVTLAILLTKDEVQESIKNIPNRYKILIDTKNMT